MTRLERLGATRTPVGACGSPKPPTIDQFLTKTRILAATLVAAEHQISRSFERNFRADYLFKILAASKTQITGWCRGRHFGVISFPSSAASYDRVQFGGSRVTHKGWGIQEGDNAARRVAAYRDVCSDPLSLHLPEGELGALPARMLGTQADVGLALAGELYVFCCGSAFFGARPSTYRKIR